MSSIDFVLKEFCLGCAKYASGDVKGQIFAIVCVAPFLALYHIVLLAYLSRYGEMAIKNAAFATLTCYSLPTCWR